MLGWGIGFGHLALVTGVRICHPARLGEQAFSEGVICEAQHCSGALPVRSAEHERKQGGTEHDVACGKNRDVRTDGKFGDTHGTTLWSAPVPTMRVQSLKTFESQAGAWRVANGAWTGC